MDFDILDTVNRKRVKVKPSSCPNPLFEQWLEEWRVDAASRNLDLQYSFGKALKSLRLYPAKLNSGKECLILKNFGTQLAVKLDRKLSEYRRAHPDAVAVSDVSSSYAVPVAGPSQITMNNDIPDGILKQRKRKKNTQPQTAVKNKPGNAVIPSPKRNRPYVPTLRSGPYAILITMLKQMETPFYPGYMLKVDIMNKAQDLCDSSFTRPDPDSHYTAWSSMSTLIRKGFVTKRGNPAKYTLTDAGQELARKLTDDLSFPNRSPTHSNRTTPISSPAENKAGKAVTPSPRRNRPYVPTLRSGPYAILITMLKQMETPPYPGFMLKVDIMNKAQDLCDSSFTRPDPDSHYTAWSSMSTLIRKGFVTKRGNPAKYTLTDAGQELARKLTDDLSFPNRSPTHSNHITPFSSPARSSVPSSSHSSPVNYSQMNSNNNSWSDSLSNFDYGDDDIYIIDDDDEPESIQSACTMNSKPTISQNSNCEQSTSTMNSQSGDNQNLIREQSTSTINSQSGDNQNLIRDANTFEQLIFPPDSYKIFLLVDTMETQDRARSQVIQETVRELTNLKTNFEKRHLKVGDFAWVARNNENKELLLPYIVERKRMDDLGKSIKDGRFHEQKFRLRQCGLQNRIYLVEKFGNEAHLGLPINTLQQAIINTQVVDNFFVKKTNSHKQSMFYLSMLTNLLTTTFKDKMLISCPRSDLPPTFDINADIVSLPTFEEFSKFSLKNKTLRIQDVFIKHLLQLKGLSVEKALAIVQKYPTPQSLKQAFNSSVNPETLLAKITFGSTERNIGPALSKSIYQLYTNKTLS